MGRADFEHGLLAPVQFSAFLPLRVARAALRSVPRTNASDPDLGAGIAQCGHQGGVATVSGGTGACATPGPFQLQRGFCPRTIAHRDCIRAKDSSLLGTAVHVVDQKAEITGFDALLAVAELETEGPD
jgi:hypothetical protein